VLLDRSYKGNQVVVLDVRHFFDRDTEVVLSEFPCLDDCGGVFHESVEQFATLLLITHRFEAGLVGQGLESDSLLRWMFWGVRRGAVGPEGVG
jgi:hypothetical protein